MTAYKFSRLLLIALFILQLFGIVNAFSNVKIKVKINDKIITNIDIEKCMLNYLSPRMNMGLLTLEQVNEIIKAWMTVTWDCSRKN